MPTTPRSTRYRETKKRSRHVCPLRTAYSYVCVELINQPTGRGVGMANLLVERPWRLSF